MRTLLFIILTSLALSAYADDNEKKTGKRGALLQKIDSGEKEKKAHAEASRPSKEGASTLRDTIARHIAARSFPDVSGYYYECYEKVVNQYGFWKGVGPRLTPEQVRHKKMHYRLLRPAGSPSGAPFTYMQVFDSFGRFTTNHDYGPLLANPHTSDNANIPYSWLWKLQSACQFEKICRNGVIVQENMYDAEGELILQYFPTSVSKNHIIGHYTDAYGTLAILRDDDDANYVSIMLDDNGYESEVTFIDKKGRLKHNGDFAFMQVLEHDKQGRLISVMSADALGKKVIDKYGNCGWRYVFDKNGRTDYCWCVNQHNRPMKMPAIQKGVDDVWKVKYTYDRWGNQTSRAFYDNNWQPDTTSTGIHRYVYTYNDRGLQTSFRAEGLHGQLVNYEDDKACWKNEYDKNGNLVYTETRNKDSLFTKKGDCIKIYRFLDDKVVFRLDYNSTYGHDTILNHKLVTKNGCDTVWSYKNNYINVTLHDKQGRDTADAYYDLAMRPIMRYGYHKTVTKYVERPGYCMKEYALLDTLNQWADINGKGYWRDYNREITETDSVLHTKSTANYDGTRLLEKFGNLYDDDFSTSLGLLYYDSIGGRGRTFKTDALYYKALSRKSVQGNNITWRGENEFGEPSYVLNGDWDSATLYCTDVIDDSYYYDENQDTIPSKSNARKEFKDKLCKAFCIELIDSVALKHGLRTGDIIVRYGDWHYPVPSVSGRYHESLLCLESVRKALHEKPMVVMRHDPITKTSRLISLPMPVGTPKQLGFVYHMLYMTERERARYERVMEEQRSTVSVDTANTSTESIERVRFITPYKVGNSKNKRLFMKGFQENAVIVAWEPYVEGKRYLFTCKNYLFDNALDNAYDSIALHYTVDGRHVERYVMSKDDTDYARCSNTKVADASDINALADSLQQAFDALFSRPVIALEPRAAADRLRTIAGARVKQNNGSAYRGDGKEEYGDVTDLYHVSVDYDSLTYDDMFEAYNILSHIDYSKHFRVDNDGDWGYLSEKKGKFTDIAWNGNKSVTILSGDIRFNPVYCYVAEVSDSGHFSQQGLQGKYILLQCNDWRFGQNKPIGLNYDGNRRITMVKMEQTGDSIVLGKPKTYTFPTGRLGITTTAEQVPFDIFCKTYQMVRRLKKPKKRDIVR